MPAHGMASQVPLVVVGDALLDRDVVGGTERLAPDAPVPVVDGCEELQRPGGAALAAYFAARDGREVKLVVAHGGDPASRALRDLLAPWVTLVPLPLAGTLPEKTRVLAQGRPLVRLDRGTGRAAVPPVGALNAGSMGGARGSEELGAAADAIRSAPALLVADYGRGSADAVRGLLAERSASVPVVWDPHPRGGPPVPRCRLATPTVGESWVFATRGGHPVPDGAELRAVAIRAAELVRQWCATAVVVTLGERGALLSYGDDPLLVPAPVSHTGDSCGAGDRFAATATGLLAEGALPEEAVQGAVTAATNYVVSGGPGTLATERPRCPQGQDAEQVVGRVRAAGGIVVAAGGCFDLLHAGHVGMLQAARRIGSCLVVCLNSDASVRRRKGEGRPINPLADRARVLTALECVDAVAVFEEDTPERLLSRLRPDVWVKGGDYTLAELPEAALLERWGGQAVLLPYLDGRSSTRIAARAAMSSVEAQR